MSDLEERSKVGFFGKIKKDPVPAVGKLKKVPILKKS
jgi:hypothetical protein